MGLTNAERQRRYRERKRAEQQRASGGVTAAVTPQVTRNDVTQLGPRGRRLWEQLTKDGSALKPAERVLAEEACRTADRLDTLDRILRGDEDAWMRFRSLNEDGSVVSVVINNALAEARQQQVTLKALLAELRTSQAGGSVKPGVGRPAEAPKTGGGGVAGVTSLAARIAAKRGGQAAG